MEYLLITHSLQAVCIALLNALIVSVTLILQRSKLKLK